MEGHRERFEETYDTYAKAIFRFIYFRVSEHGLAEDIAQDTFLRYWKRLSSGNDIENPRALLYTIAHGLIIDHYRKKKYRIHVPLDIEKIDADLAFTTDDSEHNAIVKEEIGNVLAKLAMVKDEYREIVLMHYVEDLKVPEIAALLNKTDNSVRVLIHRALKALRTKL